VIKSFKALASTSPTSTPPSLPGQPPFKHVNEFDLLGEKDPVTFSCRVDTDVVLGVGGVRTERLNNEGVEGTSGRLDSLGLSCAGLDPRTSLLPLLVQTQESSLSSSLDKLIGLSDELRVEDPFWETSSWSNGRRKSLGRVVADC
jgi:hypothetical protein